MTDTLADSSPFPQSPVTPATLEGGATLQFQCRKGIACCSNIDIALTPVDIVRLKNRLCLASWEFLQQYTVPYETEQDGIAGDELARGWRQLILKKKSSGPTVGKPSKRSRELFFMTCYDADRLRSFVVSEAFSEVFDVPPEELRTALEDDFALLQFGYRFLRQVLFGEMTITLRADSVEKRRPRLVEQRARLEREAAERQARDDDDAAAMSPCSQSLRVFRACPSGAPKCARSRRKAQTWPGPWRAFATTSGRVLAW